MARVACEAGPLVRVGGVVEANKRNNSKQPKEGSLRGEEGAVRLELQEKVRRAREGARESDNKRTPSRN